MAGGDPGARGLNLWIRNNGKIINIGGKASCHVKAGDRLRIMTPGGGGYGAAEKVVNGVGVDRVAAQAIIVTFSRGVTVQIKAHKLLGGVNTPSSPDRHVFTWRKSKTITANNAEEDWDEWERVAQGDLSMYDMSKKESEMFWDQSLHVLQQKGVSSAHCPKLVGEEYTQTIKELQDRLAAYENAAQARNPVQEPELVNNTPPTTQENLAVTPRPTLTPGNPPCFGNNTVARGLGLPPQDTLPGTSPHSNPEPSVPSPRSVIPTDPPLSSSYNFGSRVRSLVVESAAIPYPEAVNYVPTAHLLHSKTRSANVFDLPTFPTEEEAYRLLNTHISFIGNTQNLFDAREVSDRIGLLYANRQDAGYNTANLETLEILLIFAIARLFLADFGRSAPHTDTVPGQTLFDFVCERIPPLGQLYYIGRLGVEILLLQAVYYVNINRKEEAYIHTSTALRLAVAHGFHRKHTQKHMLQSEATHINRLWWSVYLHERRLAAVTGNPFGINDSVIEQDLPTDSFGFTPAAPMRTSIKLAQIYGQIIMGSYLNNSPDNAIHLSADSAGAAIAVRASFITPRQTIQDMHRGG
ncbi:hypothetical protein NPX13_g11074 [Xylaria arbuscula]|uniref:Xylanolytic transcriptional activator regulatory domain-containing protein n=1 Tax=Xylaria arbuscula TaxID=114810 RepID=A0A9W8THA1_9PEZI|nr:hypothetical protein NPX13_g11074 [Xylaria arbuscula]